MQFHMAAKATEIIIQFRRPPHVMFPLPPGQGIAPNILTLCLQPDEGIHLRTQAKVPGTVADTSPVDLEFHYRDYFGAGALPEAYERLLLDALHGDAALFTRADRAELAWKLAFPPRRSSLRWLGWLAHTIGTTLASRASA